MCLSQLCEQDYSSTIWSHRTLILTVFFGWIGDIISCVAKDPLSFDLHNYKPSIGTAGEFCVCYQPGDAVAGKEDEKEGTEKENKEKMKNKYQSNSLNLVMKEQKKKVRELHTEVKKVQHMLLLKILNLILVVKMIIGQLKNKMKRIQVQVVIVMSFGIFCWNLILLSQKLRNSNQIGNVNNNNKNKNTNINNNRNSTNTNDDNRTAERNTKIACIFNDFRNSFKHTNRYDTGIICYYIKICKFIEYARLNVFNRIYKMFDSAKQKTGQILFGWFTLFVFFFCLHWSHICS